MKMTNRILTVAASVAVFQAGLAADITGKITLKGTPPPEKSIAITDAATDKVCGDKSRTTPLTTRLYVVGSAGELADVFVYIKEGLTGKTFEVPTQPVVLDQKGCEYVPYVLGLQTKQKLLVKNSDPLMHNVHPTPDPKSGNKESNKAQMPAAGDLTFTFDNPEVLLRFKCDVHGWMFAYAGVLPHPYYAVTGKDGSFKIANVPPGTYTVEAFHRKAGKTTQKVTVGNESQKADFTLEVPKAQ